MEIVGSIRKIDELGRLVIPAEIREQLNIRDKDSLEILLFNGSILIKKLNAEQQ